MTRKHLSVFLIYFLLAVTPLFGQISFGAIGSLPSINTGPLPNGQKNNPYSTTLSAIGGTPGYTWALFNSTTLPAGLSLGSTTGTISGTPTGSGQTTFQVQVTDGAGRLSNPVTFTITILSTLIINNASFPVGTVGVLYSSSPVPSAAGGQTPYSWSCCVTGALPAGTTMNATTGVVSGTPTTGITYNFTYKVTDATLATATQANTIIVNSAGSTCGPPGYLCSSTSAAIIQYPTAPFSTSTPTNTIACDPSINGACNSTSGISPMVRATDPTTGGTGFVIDASGGAGDNIVNTDDTLIAVIPYNTGAACILGFTPATMQVTTSCTNIPNSHYVSWSNTVNNTMYTLSANSPKIYKTVFTSPTAFTQTMFFDPVASCSIITGQSVTGASLSISLNDRYFAGGLITNQQNSVGFFFVYDSTANQCAAFNTANGQVELFNGTVSASTAPCTPIGFHNGNIFSNGTYARMTTGTIGACTNIALYWQINTTNIWGCSPQLSGHNSSGYNIEVQISNPTFHYSDVTAGNATYCANLLSQTYGSSISNVFPGDIEEHFGLNHLSAAETEPIVGGSAYANWPGTPWNVPGVNEVWAFQRSPFKWIRFTHQFISGSVLCPTCDFRVVNGIVTQSQSGKFALFSSDMLLGLGNATSGSGTGQPRSDVFIVRLD